MWILYLLGVVTGSKDPPSIISNGHKKPLITNGHTTKHVAGVRWSKAATSSKGRPLQCGSCWTIVVAAPPKKRGASLNCTVQIPNAGSRVKIAHKGVFLMSCGVRCVSCWMIVVAAPAKRGEGLPRLCDSTPTQRRTTYGDKRYAMSSALWNKIFYNSGAHKKW